MTPTPDQKWEARWDFIWGEAPPDSIKYQKGQEIKAFITSLLAEARAEGERAFKRQMSYYGYGDILAKFEDDRAKNGGKMMPPHLQASDKGK